MDWQPIIALLIVAMAAGWLARRVYRIAMGGSRGGCGTCVKNPSADDASPLVQLGKKKE